MGQMGWTGGRRQCAEGGEKGAEREAAFEKVSLLLGEEAGGGGGGKEEGESERHEAVCKMKNKVDKLIQKKNHKETK